MTENLRKVLITAKVHPYLVDYLTEKGYQVLYYPAISYDEVYQNVHGCVGLIVTTRIKVDAGILDNAPRLQWIGRLGSGMEMIDVAYATHKGIRCVSSPEGNCDAVGEHVVGSLLSLFGNIVKSNLQLRENIWEREKNRGIELKGKTVGIIGYGHTGSAVAHKLQGFECNILAYDKYKTDFGSESVQEVPLEELYRQADIISVHLPLTDETHHMVDDAFLRSFTGPLYVVNTSRGKIIHTADLIDNLKSGHVTGACLDVLENEKLDTLDETERAQFDYLLHSDHVILTPHIAGYSQEAAYKTAHIVLKKLGI
jgi:D-3-phosphoglycerate dehydrogenase